MKLASYHELDYRFSYLSTQSGAEVDLIVERPGQYPLFIEIKSSPQVNEEALRTLAQLAKDFGSCEAICLSRDPYPKQYDQITVYPWQEGILKYFSPEPTSERDAHFSGSEIQSAPIVSAMPFKAPLPTLPEQPESPHQTGDGRGQQNP
jgi:hypothetical protein